MEKQSEQAAEPISEASKVITASAVSTTSAASAASAAGGEQQAQSSVKIFGTADDSIVDGPGIRFAVFTQGCSHRCTGCHNPEAQPFEGGKVVTTQTLLARVDGNPLIAGITLSGGEPFEQAAALVPLARAVRKRDLTIWAYSGYSYEELLGGLPNIAAAELLQEVDVLVDGPYIAELKSLDLRWRGSANQRIIDVAASLATHEVVLWSEK